MPSVKIGQQGGYAQITIRGIGTSSFVPGSETPVAFNLNDVYVSRAVAQQTGLFDVSAIEVLRGPQGTLYGRNATAGSMNVTTARPTNALSGQAQFSYGNYDALRFEAALGGALVEDKLLVRVAGFYENRDGYGKNLATGRDIDDKNAFGVRGTIVLALSQALKATFIGEYYEQDDASGMLHYFGPAGLSGRPGATGVAPLFQRMGGFTAQNSFDVATGIDKLFKLDSTALTGIVEWDVGDISVKSVTGYRKQDSFIATPLDGGSTSNAYFQSGEPSDQFSQELQFNYSADKFALTAGAFYFDEDNGVANDFAVAGQLFNVPVPYVGLSVARATLKTKAAAVFGQASVEATPDLTVILGGRYSWERKGMIRQLGSFIVPVSNPNLPAAVTAPSCTFKAFTPKVGLNYQANPDMFLYASYSKGFKAGGFDTSDALTRTFEPEKVTSYEVGMKNRLFGNRATLNLSAFYYDYTDLQVQQVVNNLVFTRNAGSARNYGFEMELNTKLTPELMFGGSAAYIHARYKNFAAASAALPRAGIIDYDGRTLNNAPEWSGQMFAEYEVPMRSGALSFRGELEFSSQYFFSPDELDLMSENGFAKSNAIITYRASSGVTVMAFIRNITNAFIRTSGLVNAELLGTPAQGAVAPPRTYGVQVGFRF